MPVRELTSEIWSEFCSVYGTNGWRIRLQIRKIIRLEQGLDCKIAIFADFAAANITEDPTGCSFSGTDTNEDFQGSGTPCNWSNVAGSPDYDSVLSVGMKDCRF